MRLDGKAFIGVYLIASASAAAQITKNLSKSQTKSRI
jgi:hypothetical protein